MPITDCYDFDYANTRLSHIDGVLSYDIGAGRQAAVGEYVRGNTSGAIGKILSVTGNTTSGTLTLTNVLGLFQDNETFEVMSEIGFDAIVDKAATLQGFRIGDVVTDQVSGSVTVQAIEYNEDGLGGGVLYGTAFTSFADNSQLDISGGETNIALSDTATGPNVDNDAALTTTQTAGTLAVPGTAQTNDSVIIHYDAGTVAVPEQAIVEDAITGATALVEQVYGVTATGSLRLVDYNSTGGVFADGNALRADQVILYNNQVAGQVFTVGDVVVGGTSSATGRVLADTGTALILADESGTWTTTEDLNVDSVKIAEANGTNTTLNLATIDIPSGIRTEQRPNSVGGSVGQGGIYAAATSLNVVRKLNSLYTLNQDTFDELDQLDDDEAMDAAAKAIAYSLTFGWVIPDLTFRFVRRGAMSDSTGANIWANPQTGGTQNKITNTAFDYSSAQPYRQPQLYVEQNGAKVDPFWLEGQMDALLKTRTRTDTRFIAPATPSLGQLIPGGDPATPGNYTIFNREFHVSNYDATQADGSLGGVNNISLGTGDNTANSPNGTHTMNYTAGSAATLIDGEEFTAGSGNSLKVGVVVSDTGGAGATGTLEYVLKSGTNFVNTDACTATISGKTFTAPTPTTVVAGFSADVSFPVVDIKAESSPQAVITGTFSPGEAVSQAVTGATGRFVYADTALAELYIEVTSGTFSGDNTITGGSSAATWNPGVTTQTYNTISAFSADLNNGDGVQPYTGTASGNLTGGGSPETIVNVYQYGNYLTRAEEDGYIVNGPGLTDVGTVGRFYRKLADAFAEIKPGEPIGTSTGISMFLGTGWFVDSSTLNAADIRSFRVTDNNGINRSPPNLQSMSITGGENLVRAASFRSTGAGLLPILRNEFDVGVVGAGNNQAADSTILIGANTRSVSPTPADVPDTGVLYVLDPNDTGTYLQFPYSSVNRTTNVFTLTSGTIGAVTGAVDLTLNDNVHVAFIREIMSGPTVSTTLQYVADIPIVYKGRLKGKKPFRGTSTFTSTGMSAPLTLNDDPIVDLP